MDYYFDSYAELSLQRLMVADRPRTDAFAAAIKEVLRGGERVVDVGTGTGLLAMLAAKAGAKKVYAIDQASIAKAAIKNVERNDLADTVEVVKGNASGFQLTEPVDLIVSEWLGHFAFVENMLDDVLTCRDQNLKQGGAMLPSHVELMLAPVDSPFLYDEEGPGFWKNTIHGIDFSHLESVELQQSIATKTFIHPDDLLAPGKPMMSLDLVQAAHDDIWQSGTLRYTAQRDGRLDGFAGWFVAQLSPSVRLDTAPGLPSTHWQQTYFAFPTREVAQGELIEIRFSLSKHPVEERSIQLDLEMGDERYIYTVG